MYSRLAILLIGSIVVGVVSTGIVRYLAGKLGAVDIPNEDRKRHQGPMPLMGGLAVFLTFALGLAYVWPDLTARGLADSHWLGFIIGGAVLQVGGYLDDRYRLKPGWQIVFPLAAIAAVIIGGVRIERMTNPLGGLIEFGPGLGAVAAISIIGLWLMGMMYTTKLLDGIDGLVTGVAAIGAAVIFLFTMTTRYYQPDVGIASLLLLGSCLGFLVWNWHPARIFLGEGGSLFLGYALGVLSIISGGKIAIALLVMGLPALDVAWTIIRRLRAGVNPFRIADRSHLHFRLHDRGLGSRGTVVFYCLVAAIFGFSGLWLQSRGKLLALAGLAILMIGLIAIFNTIERRRADRLRS